MRILTFSENAKSRREGTIYYIRSMPFEVYPDVRMPLSYRHKLIRELVAWKPDVIHSQCEFFSYQYAKRIAKKTGAPLVHTYHTLYEQYATYVVPNKRLGRYAVRVLSKKRLKTANVVVAPTHKVKAALQGYGLENEISVVPSGISLEQHKRRITPEQRAQMRRELGIAEDQTVLINLGRLGNEKNLDELVSYFSAASAELERLVFLIVGDGPARAQLQKQAEKAGVSDRVIFTGMVDPKRVQEYYQLGDLFVSASTSETQGLTYVEAAANGLPLLCRQDLCHKGVLVQGENGYEYTCEEEFMAGLRAVISDPAWRINAKKRSEEIADRFDKKAFGTAIENIYTELLK